MQTVLDVQVWHFAMNDEQATQVQESKIEPEEHAGQSGEMRPYTKPAALSAQPMVQKPS